MWIDDIDIEHLVTAYGKLKPINALSVGVILNLDLSQTIHEVLADVKDENILENFVACDIKKMHVYLMPLLCNEHRIAESWSIHIPIDISYDEIKTIINSYYLESFSEQPYRLKFKNISIHSNKLCIKMESADLETSHTLSALRDFTLNTLGFRILDLEPFEIRIHLGLWTIKNIKNFSLEIEDLRSRLTERYSQSIGILELDGAKILEHSDLFDLKELKIT